MNTPPKTRRQRLRDSLRNQIKNAQVQIYPGAFRIYWRNEFFNWPDHTGGYIATMPGVLSSLAMASVSSGSGLECQFQINLINRYHRRHGDKAFNIR